MVAGCFRPTVCIGPSTCCFQPIFAVQLAAPATEQDARSASAKLAAKFAEPLGGRRPIVVKAEVGDKSIYRVRVSSLSREEAVSLCEKVKAEGGTCFVAKN